MSAKIIYHDFGKKKKLLARLWDRLTFVESEKKSIKRGFDDLVRDEDYITAKMLMQTYTFLQETIPYGLVERIKKGAIEQLSVLETDKTTKHYRTLI
jgi:hypothetical protein